MAAVEPLSLPVLLLLEELMDVIGGHDLSQENPGVQVLPTLKTNETCSPRMPLSGIMSQQVMAVNVLMWNHTHFSFCCKCLQKVLQVALHVVVPCQRTGSVMPQHHVHQKLLQHHAVLLL